MLGMKELLWKMNNHCDDNCYMQKRETAGFTNLWFEFLGLAGNWAHSDDSGDI